MSLFVGSSTARDAVPFVRGGIIARATHVGDTRVWPPKSNFWAYTIADKSSNSSNFVDYSKAARAAYCCITNSGCQYYRFDIDKATATLVGITVAGASGFQGIAFDDAGLRAFTVSTRVDTGVAYGGLWELDFAATPPTVRQHVERPANSVGVAGGKIYIGHASQPYGVTIYDHGNSFGEITAVGSVPLTNSTGSYWAKHPLHPNVVAIGSTSGNCVSVIDTQTNTLVKTMTHPTGAGSAVALSKTAGKVYTAKQGLVNRFDVDSGIVDLQYTAPAGANIWSLTSVYNSETGGSRLLACSRGSDSAIYVFDDSVSEPTLLDVIPMPTRSPTIVTPYDGSDWVIACSASRNADLIYIGPDPNPAATSYIGSPWEVVPPHEPYPELPEQPAPEPEPLPEPEPVDDEL